MGSKGTESKARPPHDNEVAWLKRAEQIVNSYLEQYEKEGRGIGLLDHTEEDLERAQEVLEREKFPGDRVEALMSLGAVLGNVFVDHTPLRWRMISNVFGTNLGLYYRKMGLTLYPLTMILQRVQDGREVDIPGLYEGTVVGLKLPRKGG